MRIRVTKLMDGPGPGEALIQVWTSAGNAEELIVHGASMQGNAIDVGKPIFVASNSTLVELPRETMSGSWRVWVAPATVV